MEHNQQFAYEDTTVCWPEETGDACGAAQARPDALPVQRKDCGLALLGEDGHFTAEGLRAIVEDGLDEMQRLEAAEHLSFCDSCLLRYTELLADDTLLEPEQPVAPSVLQRIRRQTMRVLVNRYTTVAAAAVFALIIWGTGVFDVIAARPDYHLAMDARPPLTVTSRMSDFLRDASAALTHSIGNAFAALSTK